MRAALEPEVAEVLAGELPSAENIDRLPLVAATLKETMRLLTLLTTAASTRHLVGRYTLRDLELGGAFLHRARWC